MSFLRQNTSSCSPIIKAECYKTLVLPIVEYAATIWDPHTHTTTSINKLKAVQLQAARFVYSDYKATSSTSAMVTQLQWPTLQQRRADAKTSMIYRFHYGLVDIPANIFQHPTALSTKGHSLKFMLPYCRTDVTYTDSAFPLWYSSVQPAAGCSRHSPVLGLAAHF